MCGLGGLLFGLDLFLVYITKDPFGFLVTNHKDQICKLLKVWGADV